MGRCRGVLVSLFIAGLTACGAPARPPELRPVERHDDAAELAALLPDALERCVVVRPGRLAERRRSLALLQSWAEPDAYGPELPVVAYASAVAEGYGGRQARRSYLRFAPGTERLEARAREALPVRWLDEPCDGMECRRPVARWVDERTLEVARHEWPRRELAASSAACVQVARAHGDAFEVAVDTRTRIGPMPIPQPRLTRRVLSVDGGALVTRRELVFRDAIQARVFERFHDENEASIEATLMPLAASRRRLSRDEERVLLEDRRLWEELELALEDERLRRRAITLDRERSEPAPLSRVDVENLAVVRHQVRLRQTEVARLTGERREQAAATLATLLERAAAAHPAETELVRTLVRLELDLLVRPARAVAAIDRVIASGVAQRPAEWRSMRRDALSHVSAEALAGALVADGVAEAPVAADAAEDLLALREGGVPYEWAEGAWTLSRSLGGPRRLPHLPPLPHRADARLPFEGAIAAVVGYARIRGGDVPCTVQLVVRTADLGPARAVGESRPELVVVRGPAGGSSIVGALPSVELVALRRLGRSLATLVPPGPVEVVVSLRHPDGGDDERLVIQGERQGEDLVIQRVGEPLRRAPWPVIGRYLARPLAELPTALFPPPELTVRAESAEAAAELRRAAEPLVRGDCRVAGPVLRCQSPGRPAQLGEILLRIARARLGDGV